MRHVGRFADRLTYPCHSTDRESAFAEQWRLENERCAVLARLIASEAKVSCLFLPGVIEQVITRDVTTAEEENAATVIQWLGTHVGFDFVCQALKRCGYLVVRDRSVEAKADARRLGGSLSDERPQPGKDTHES